MGRDTGIYDAINKGLEVATGDIICVLNADDYYPSDRILSFVVTKMCNSNLDILMGDVVFFSSKNRQTRLGAVDSRVWRGKGAFINIFIHTGCA
ncbi:MAG: glycosyltransferase [Betaproteobacteria bacterium]|nr:glycosyltransferase [Betaproteobacteria bacterium]